MLIISTVTDLTDQRLAARRQISRLHPVFVCAQVRTFVRTRHRKQPNAYTHTHTPSDRKSA